MQRYQNMSRDDLVRLLASAEERLRAETDQDALRQLHDLELHQIELELSNRELTATQAELEASRERFAILFDFAPVAYLGLDRNGMIAESNLAAAKLFGLERAKLSGLPLGAVLGKGNRSRALNYVRSVFANEGVTSEEFRVVARGSAAERDLRLDSCITTGVDGSSQCLTTLIDLTELRTAQRQLSGSHQELKALVAAAPIGIGIVRQRVFQSVSPRMLALTGFAEQELIGKSARMIYPDRAEFERVGRVKYAAMSTSGVGEVETVWRRRDGALIDVLLRSAALDPADLDAGVVFTVMDISARKRAERELEAARQQLELALAGGDLGTYSARLPGGAIEVDARYLAMLGFRPGELRLDWDAWLAMIHPDDRPAVEERAAPVLAGEIDTFGAEYRMRHRQGHWVWVLDRARAHHREAETIEMAGTHVDITRRREAEGRVLYLVEHDALTELLNRRGIMRSIETIHAQALRSGRPFALAILDLDHFKEVNDAYGHAVGDVVLRSVGAALHAEMRSADWVGRWGGEEFIIVIPDCGEATAMATLQRVRGRVGERTIEAEGQTLHITLSAGLAVFQAESDTLDTLIERADAAMYLAKQRGRDRIVFAGGEEGEQAVFIAGAIAEAVRDDSIEVCGRPLLDLRSRERCGEALVARIPHPSCNELDGGICLEIAQQLGLMHQIDRVVVEAACRRLQAEGQVGEAMSRQILFAPLSGDSIKRPEHLERLAEVLPPRPSAPDAGLVLLVDEARIALEPEQVLAALTPLLERGCRLAIDRVGGAGSSHRFLIELPASYLILDAELVRGGAESTRARAVLSGLLRVADDLGCVTIARGADDEATRARLSHQGIAQLLAEQHITPGP
jgi:diguanylate cyclase (GGDEF)-like protein/PAS domain S-box-containing protein